MNPTFIVEKLHPEAKLPVYSTTKAADCDLFASEYAEVPAKGYGLVKTGLRMIIPAGWRLKLESRSGLALKKGINIGAGVIDEDYRGEIGVVVFNHGDSVFRVEIGDKICQASVERYTQAIFKEGIVDERDAESNRVGGFGSTDSNITVSGNITVKGVLFPNQENL